MLKGNVCKYYAERERLQVLGWQKVIENLMLKGNVSKDWADREC